MRETLSHNYQATLDLEAYQHVSRCLLGNLVKQEANVLTGNRTNSINLTVELFVPGEVFWYPYTVIALNPRVQGWRLILDAFHTSTASEHGSR